MKVIAGKFKGKTLNFRERQGLRPTSQKVKEAMFSIIGDMVEDANVLDLFCGYGGLGIEAISRGAKFVHFVDVDPQALKQVAHFLGVLGVENQGSTVKRDFIKALKHLDENSLEIIVMDPPYNANFEEKAILTIEKYNLLKPDGIIMVEHSSDNTLPDKIGKYVKFKVKEYGDTALSVYRQEGSLAGNSVVNHEGEAEAETVSESEEQ
ncbi:MAG: 16S rRNA (guanine(966)-N(2))-methyltransferase RsmD [Firmicutes bacterium]|nr:16S rRNA (guanine(966)-N(2))-methyltransferase RsmD [Bacillota bacterium]